MRRFPASQDNLDVKDRMQDSPSSTVIAPPGSCDCQVHVFGPMDKYPPLEKRSYDPPPATLEVLQGVHGAMGIERAVIAQATIYGTDHRLLLDTLKGRPNYRGVAVINDRVSDEDLTTLHAAGIRAARFGLGSSIQASLTHEEFTRTVSRVQPLGWHIKIAASSDDLAKHESWLRDLTLTVVIDHFAGSDPKRGLDQPGCRLVLDLLRQPNYWIMLANGDRRSAGNAPPWDDMRPFGEAYLAAAPDRTIWATDWPHVLYAKPTKPDDRDLLAFLRRVAPDDATFRKILVDNPARLYGFH
jgi:predicted TIM-barrel fold metal-dependent hydrolase